MKRTSRRNLTALAGVLLLAGCGAATPQASPSSPVVQAEPAALAAAPQKNCDADRKPAVASLDPNGITSNPSTWPKNSALAKIRREKKITVGVSGDALLWGSSDPRSGNLDGFDIDVLNRIAQEIAGPEVDVDYKVITYAQRLPALDKGDVQLVAHTMTINCDRWFGSAEKPDQFINFSSQYYQAGQKLLVRADSEIKTLDDLGAADKICVTAGSTNIANLAAAGVKKENTVEVANQGECLVKFQEGEVSVVTGDDTVLAGFKAQDPFAKVVGDQISVEPYGVGVAPDDEGLTRYVNLVLQEMREDGTLEALYGKYMAKYVEGDAPAVPKAVYGRDLTARR